MAPGNFDSPQIEIRNAQTNELIDMKDYVFTLSIFPENKPETSYQKELNNALNYLLTFDQTPKE